MKVTILGGGLASVSLAYFLQNRSDIHEIEIIEKEESLGGLCRTFNSFGIQYDIGPHIIFSKDQEILQIMNVVLGDNISYLRRSNQILYYNNEFIQYPFENDLSKLPKDDLNYCINGFINNPYESYEATSMLQFFLKTFGEGITNLYLRPYNEKIWKIDPAFMDTQIVERIPKPPKEDILRSAAGETVEGYTHQLYFSYPKRGGIEALLNAFAQRLGSKVIIHTDQKIRFIRKYSHSKFIVETQDKEYITDHIVSTIPVNLLTKMYTSDSFESNIQSVYKAADSLRYNSIIIAIVNVVGDKLGDNFAFMLPDKKVIFHRISKLDFLGSNYHQDNSSTFMVEITYRKNDLIDTVDDGEVTSRIIDGMKTLNIISSENDVNFTSVQRFEYAYVIYDLNHRRNMDLLISYFNKEGITLHGRFGRFEYLNMDAVIKDSKVLHARI